MQKKYCKVFWIPFFIFLLFPWKVFGQELNAKVTVISDRIKDVDPSTFKSLQDAILAFLNTRKWTSDAFQGEERINCNFVLNITSDVNANTFSAQLTIQSSRPVFDADYSANMLDYMDKNVTFKYQAFQPLDFSENRISGNDPLISNLTAILAYYAYIIIGLDYDSFSPRGGIPYFMKAQNIVNNAPEDSKSISGWKPFEGTQNRYWLVDDLLNSRFSQFHEVMYQYYRLGLDKMYSNMDAGRGAIMDCLNILSVIHEQNPSSMLIQLFFLARSNELGGIFSKAPFQDRQRALQLLSQLDVADASKYEGQLK